MAPPGPPGPYPRPSGQIAPLPPRSPLGFAPLAPPGAPGIVLPELPAEKSFGERLQSLLAMDCFRIGRIFETAQYAVLYACICLPVGLGIDMLCKPLYPKAQPAKDGEEETYRGGQLWRAIAAAVLQVMLSAVSIIYVRKLADLVPFLFNFCPARYVAHYHVDEVFGEIAIAMIFVGIQTSLLDALARIRRSL